MFCSFNYKIAHSTDPPRANVPHEHCLQKYLSMIVFFLYIELSIPKLSSHIKYKYIKIITLKMVSFPVISITVPK